MKIRIGVAGLGAVAQSVHLPLIQRRWDLFELAAVADLSPSQAADVGRQFGVPAERCYASLTDMLDAEDLDGVLLLTSGSHGAPALECIRRGVAVFCEKPLALSLAEVDAIQAAEKESDRPLLLLAYMKEYDPAVVRLRELLPPLAEIRYVNVEVLHPSGSSQLAFARLRPPAADIDPEALAALRSADDAVVSRVLGDDAPAALRQLYSGVVLGSLVHDISLVRSLFGPVARISTATVWAEQDNPGSVEISGTLAENARLHMHWHYLENYPCYRETVTIHHTTGSFELEFTVPYLLNAPTQLRIVTSQGTGESSATVRDVTEAFEVELEAFHAMVQDSVPPPTGAAEGRTDLETGQAIARALAEGLGITITGEAAR